MKIKLLILSLLFIVFSFESYGSKIFSESTTFDSYIQSQDIKDFTISPNPATSKINLRLKSLDTKTTLTVYDVLGKKILSKEIDQLITTLDISRWNNGVYLVRLTSNKETLTKRFVKQ